MHNDRETTVRDALWRLTERDASSENVLDATPRLFLGTPAIALLWMLSVMGVVGLLVLARVRIPRVISGAAVAVNTPPRNVGLLLLLPASARPHVRPGQVVEVMVRNAPALALRVVAVEPELLNVETAQHRFPSQPSILAQLDGPRLAVHLSDCADQCLTLRVGDTYRARGLAGTRSLASYAMAGT